MSSDVALGSFEDFLNEYQTHIPPPDADSHEKYFFRGQANCAWEIESTLQRLYPNIRSVYQYCSILNLCTSEYNSVLNTNFEFLDRRAFQGSWNELLRSQQSISEFIVQLRHFGFPSPLVDWSMSPFVAAYFAYSSYRENTDSPNVAIYVYLNSRDGSTGGWVGEPAIEILGPHIKTTPRHHTQQCQYTVCLTNTDPGDTFGHYSDAINQGGHQYIVRKFLLPGSERKAVLEQLSTMNINAYTLFNNEEGLCEFLAHKHFE